MAELSGNGIDRGDRPLVSIVVPVRDGARWLKTSLDSIVAQTYSPLEIIVMDDASTDDSVAIASAYGAPVRVVRQPGWRGQYYNVNDGVQLAQGELVGVFHADDVYEPQIVQRAVAALSDHPELAAVFAQDVFIGPDGVEFGRLVLPPDVPADQPMGYATVLNGILRHKNTFLRCPGTLVRAEVYGEIGPFRPDKSAIAADLEMWLRISRRYPVMITAGHLFRYRYGHSNASDEYHNLRIQPDDFFTLMDEELTKPEAKSVVMSDALAAFEAHRCVDQVMMASSHYMRGDVAAARSTLAAVDLRRALASDQIARAQLLANVVVIAALARVPHSKRAANLLAQRRRARSVGRSVTGVMAAGWRSSPPEMPAP